MKYLDISDINFDPLFDEYDMFDKLLNIIYINNICNITNDALKKEKIIISLKETYAYYNLTNYIIIKYKESMSYFLFNDNCPEWNEISYINN